MLRTEKRLHKPFDQVRALALTSEWLNEYDTLPTIHEPGKIWLRLFPAVHERPVVICDLCHGTGYQTIDTETGSGARRCPQRCFAPDGSYQSVSPSARPPTSDGTLDRCGW